MSPLYDPKAIEECFDEMGLDEWERMVRTPTNRVGFHIHNHYLQQYIKQGDNVLEIGPGPGRYTIELAKLGAKISIIDISSVQLQLNQQKVTEAGYEEAIAWRKKMDIRDLSELEDESFDAIVAYGGPLSYVFEYVRDALGEVIRVTRTNGYIFLGVMSTVGTFQYLLEEVFKLVDDVGIERTEQALMDGNVIGNVAAPNKHYCHMFRWSELREILSEYPCEIVIASASAVLSNSLSSHEILEEIMKDQKSWNAFLRWELDVCKESGAIDCGTHMIVVLRKK